MKKSPIAILILIVSITAQSQNFIRGSVRKNADPNKIDIVFRPTYTSITGEFVTNLQFSLAIPVGVSAGITATAVGVNAFSNMTSFITDIPHQSYTAGAEQIYSFYFGPIAPGQSQKPNVWTSGVDFIGVTVTFSTAAAATVGKMVDFSNYPNNPGGGNSNTFFVIGTSTGDKTDYTCPSPFCTGLGMGNPFFAMAEQSFVGTDKNGDHFVQTLAKVSGNGGR